MIQDELRALYDQMSDEEKNENSVLKGRFTKYITRRLEWHAIRYAETHKVSNISKKRSDSRLYRIPLRRSSSGDKICRIENAGA